MGASTIPSPERLQRFDRLERWVHWSTALLVGVCLATAAALWFAPISVLVGRRDLVKHVHVVAGLAVVFPYLAARFGPWRSRTQLRRDVDRLNRFDDHDRRWLRTLGRDPWIERSKFNAGQKLNAAFSAGALLLLLGSGSIMRWFAPFPLAWRTGATFVHDWTAFALLIVLAGHVMKALSDPEAMSAMVRGSVSVRWAQRKAPRWLAEFAEPGED